MREAVFSKWSGGYASRLASALKNALAPLVFGQYQNALHKRLQARITMGYVRDGSSSGAIVKGYHTNQVIAAELNSKEVVPLYQELYYGGPSAQRTPARRCTCAWSRDSGRNQ